MSSKNEVKAVINAPKELGWGKTIVLGVQHLFAMFGATILVPLITGLDVQVTLLAAGVGTLLFHFITKGKVPAFLGSSFAFLGGFAAVSALDTGVYAGLEASEKLPYATGGIVFAGLVYVLFSGLISIFGVKKIMRFFPPVVTGPMIILIGLILAPTAVSNIMTPIEGVPMWGNYVMAILSVAIIVVCNIWGKGMVRILPILLGVVISYIVAAIFGWVNFSNVMAGGVVAVPSFAIAKFDISAIIIMVPIALATMMEHIADVAAISASVGKNFIAKPGLNKTLLGDGIATSLAALVGGPANTTYGENTGVLVLTKVYDPIVMRIAAVAAILLSLFPPVAGIIYSIPGPIIGGISFVLYGMISAVGVRNVVENQVDFTKSRNLITAAVIMVSGLGFTSGITFNIAGASITLSGLAIAAILGILLNAIFPGNDYEFNESIGENEDEIPEVGETKTEEDVVIAEV